LIEITSTAQEYFRQLVSRQDLGSLGLRIRVLAPGTPRASCDLQFCPEDEVQPGDLRQQFDGFNLFVANDSAEWLTEAEIDFEEDSAGGQLNIRAPSIKGDAPGTDAPLSDRVAWVLETEINPQLASHGGQVSLVEITPKTEVVLQFGGGCHGCGMADVTLKQGIEKTLSNYFPEITAILDATDHSSGENPYYA
jgi:Fe/S biogenesis protein NfuA